MKDFLIGALASAMVIGVVLVMGTAGTTDYGRLHGRVADGPLTLAGLMLVLLCLLFELGAVPAHAWMPDVAEGAPAPAAAFLTVVPKIGAAVALARFVSLFPPEDGALRLLIAILSAVTITAGNLAAFRSDDVRRLLGWSSVGQSGYALMAVAVAGLSAAALPALTVFVGAYALANICAFGVVTHLRGRTDLADYAGLARNRRLVATGMILAFLSVVGIPPLAGFVGKFALIMATIDGGYGWLALFGIANSVLSLFPYARVIGPMVFAASDARPGVLGCSSGLVALVAAGALVVVGIFCGSNPADAAGDPPAPGWRQVTVRPDRQLRHRRRGRCAEQLSFPPGTRTGAHVRDDPAKRRMGVPRHRSVLHSLVWAATARRPILCCPGSATLFECAPTGVCAGLAIFVAPPAMFVHLRVTLTFLAAPAAGVLAGMYCGAQNLDARPCAPRYHCSGRGANIAAVEVQSARAAEREGLGHVPRSGADAKRPAARAAGTVVGRQASRPGRPRPEAGAAGRHAAAASTLAGRARKRPKGSCCDLSSASRAAAGAEWVVTWRAGRSRSDSPT